MPRRMISLFFRVITGVTISICVSGPGAFANHVLKGPVIFRPAIRISGAVFLHRTDVNGAGPDRFGPTNRDREKMRIAKGHVGDWNTAAVRRRRVELIFGNGDILVGERGAANRPEVIELHDEPPLHAVEIGDVGKGAEFPILGELAVSRVK